MDIPGNESDEVYASRCQCDATQGIARMPPLVEGVMPMSWRNGFDFSAIAPT
jgi:hypothetical protein